MRQVHFGGGRFVRLLPASVTLRARIICGLWTFVGPIAVLSTASDLTPAIAQAGEATKPLFSVQEGAGHWKIRYADQTIAEYVTDDEAVRRPYLRHLKTRSGIQVTRTHPPVKNVDIDDHPTMHPGMWLAFGDLNGHDFWRNHAVVRQTKVLQPPADTTDRLRLIVENVYEADRQPLATEARVLEFRPHPHGYVISWQSTFQPVAEPLRFGDQEEMGLGLRLATPLAVKNGGLILNADGRKNGDEVWGHQSNWCEYSGLAGSERVGLVLVPSPRNFRRSWFHARDYGLLVANPFGVQAFTKAAPSELRVEPGEQFVLGFQVLVLNMPADEPIDRATIYGALAPTDSEEAKD